LRLTNQSWNRENAINICSEIGQMTSLGAALRAGVSRSSALSLVEQPPLRTAPGPATVCHLDDELACKADSGLRGSTMPSREIADNGGDARKVAGQSVAYLPSTIFFRFSSPLL
jgi:hypothetical protein